MEDGGENKVMSIYNPTNHLINPQIITGIFKTCGLNYQPHNISLFQKGFTHRSYIVITNPEIEFEYVEGCVDLQPDSNETLEYLGDSIIGQIVSAYLYHRYPSEKEGFLTRLKIKLVRTEMLAKFNIHLDLSPHLLISKHVEDICQGRTNIRILEDTFEAFVGATYEDIYHNGYDPDHPMKNHGKAMQFCAELMVNIMEDTVNFRDLIAINDNFKEQILHYYHKTWNGIHPEYDELHVDGPTNNRIYTMGIHHPITGQLIGKGTAKKKVMAEQTASKEALEYFEKHPETSTKIVAPQRDANATSL
jgi:ribonuclease-3